MIKILKNVTNIAELAAKDEESNCERLYCRSKSTEVKHMLFRDLDYQFRIAIKNGSKLKLQLHEGLN